MFMNVATPLSIEEDAAHKQFLFDIKPVKNSSGVV